MYDPVNDILLRSSHVISLFLPLSEKFDLRAIIIIWIFLNFTAFVKPDLAKEYQLKESNFHKLARNCLCYYKEGTFKQRFKSDQTSLDPQSLLKLLIERGELAKKKK
ncbi:hypothetical protein FSP39_012995 [Pinctada imbricata]|uniref:Uncharacterized protein n=1 Tax=Pinctada imbricata TaxID=66713 RepID=A0AA89CDZ9_PINIB|nr:hypothetical protein FSP39_012995 [Pinctada imbricata]